MATYLYRLGAFAYRRRRTVAALWALVLAGVIASAVAFGGTTNDKFTVPGTESQQAQELLEQRYPEASGTYARIVFEAPAGESLTDPANKAAVEQTLAQASKAEDVSGVTNPYDPRQNVDAGAKLLKQLIEQYGGDLTRALSAYNAGSASVDRFGGVPPYPETVNYVSSILDDLSTK